MNGKVPGGKALALVFVVAFIATLCGGIILSTSDVLPLPIAVVAMGLGLFVAGTSLVAGVAVGANRAAGKSVAGSTWSGVRAAFHWLWTFMP